MYRFRAWRLLFVTVTKGYILLYSIIPFNVPTLAKTFFFWGMFTQMGLFNSLAIHIHNNNQSIRILNTNTHYLHQSSKGKMSFIRCRIQQKKRVLQISTNFLHIRIPLAGTLGQQCRDALALVVSCGASCGAQTKIYAHTSVSLYLSCCCCPQMHGDTIKPITTQLRQQTNKQTKKRTPEPNNGLLCAFSSSAQLMYTGRLVIYTVWNVNKRLWTV